MRRFSNILSSFAGYAVALAFFAGAVFASDAKVIKKVGSGEATFTPPGAAAAVKISGGETIPEKSVIETGQNVELFIETFTGAVATVRQNSKLEIQELNASNRKARLNLNSGQIVSTLDPTKKDSTDYGVVTPTGVAAERRLPSRRCSDRPPRS